MLGALAGVFLVFDLLSNVGDITEQSDSVVATLLNYAVLRLPQMVVLIMPIAVLTGGLITMNRLLASQATVVMGAAGVSIYKLASILVVGAVVLALFQLLIASSIVPAASARLRIWAAEDYVGAPPTAVPEIEQRTWASAGRYILHYETASSDGTYLSEPLLIRLTNKKMIGQYIKAEYAKYRDGKWSWTNIYGTEKGASVVLSLPLRPEDLSVSVFEPDEIGLLSLWRISYGASARGSDRASSLYRLWFQHKLAQPLGIVLMALLAAPAGLFVGRQYNIILANFGFLAVGFGYFIVDRLFFSMGSSGDLPLLLAVWAPLFIFGPMTLWIMLHRQG